MKQISYKIYHQGCWCSETTEKFPEVKFKLLTPPIPFFEDEKGSIHNAFWEISSDNENRSNNFIEAMKKHKDVLDLKVLGKEGSKAFVIIKAFMSTSTYNTLLKKKSLTVNLPFIENGYEFFNIFVEEKYRIKRILNELEEIGELKILKIGKFKKEKTILTEKQKQALQLAIAQKYYSWPRKIKLKELAEKLGVARSVYGEHLRKAEAKLFPELIKENLKAI